MGIVLYQKQIWIWSLVVIDFFQVELAITSSLNENVYISKLYIWGLPFLCLLVITSYIEPSSHTALGFTDPLNLSSLSSYELYSKPTLFFLHCLY